jgi:hypothetical protein
MKAGRDHSDRSDVNLLGAAVIVLLLLSICERVLTRPFAPQGATASGTAVRLDPFDRTVSITQGNLGDRAARDDVSRRRVLADFVSSHADYFGLHDAADRHLVRAADDARLYVESGSEPLILVTLRSSCAGTARTTVIAGAFDARSGELRMVSGRKAEFGCPVVIAGGKRARERADHSAGSVRLGL